MNIIGRIREISNLPTLPEVVFRLQSAITAPDKSADAVSSIVSSDPSLSSMVLRTANSAIFAGAATNRRITDVHSAVMRIGFTEILKISAVLGVIQQFPNTNSLIGYRAFWRHSLTAAGLAAAIAEKANTGLRGLDRISREDLFMAGLFHDIGILIYDQFFHEEFARIVDLALTSGMSYLAAEDVLSPRDSHAMLGAALLETWRIAPGVIDPVRCHHTPFKAPELRKTSVAVLALTEHLLGLAGIHSFEGDPGPVDPELWTLLGIAPAEVDSLIVLARLEAEKTDTILFFSSDSAYASSGVRAVLRSI